MNYSRLLIALIALMLSACEQRKPLSVEDNATAAKQARIQRIVCFKFKAGTSPQARQQHMQGFAHLKDSIPSILSYHAGPTVKGDLDTEPEYDVMHYCIYRSEEAIRAYAVHPAHLRFIEENKDHWEKVLVINSLLEQ